MAARPPPPSVAERLTATGPLLQPLEQGAPSQAIAVAGRPSLIENVTGAVVTWFPTASVSESAAA